jgi:hypothetical protein
MENNFNVLSKEFSSCCMQGESHDYAPVDGVAAIKHTDCGCFPADGGRIMDDPNIMDFPVNGTYFATNDNPFGTPAIPAGTIAGGQSSSGGGAASMLTAENIGAGLQAATAAIGALGNKKQLSEVESVCGKQKKGIFVGKKKKAAWQQCANQYMQSKVSSSKQQEPQGMGTGTMIAIGLGSILLIGGVVLLIVKLKPKAVAPALAIAK